MAVYLPRYLEQTVKQLSKSFPVVMLTGARQVGKTTLLERISQSRSFHREYVTLDEYESRTLAKNDPGLFLERYPPPLIIDEIQYAPQLLSIIKLIVDREKKAGMYWLTGSQQFHLMRNISESLAGRVGIIKMLGLSLAEEQQAPWKRQPWQPSVRADQRIKRLTVHQLFEHIIRGSFPRLWIGDTPPLDAFYGSYVQTYIDRDLRDLVKVSSLSSFEKFIRVCAARTGSVLNFSDLARDSDVSVNTAKEWLSLLEASGHIYLLQSYHTNRLKRLIKAPKLYFLDTGLVTYLTGWRDPIATARGAFSGALFETFVLGELLKSYWHRGIEPRLYYYRTKEKAEVDFLLDYNGTLFPIEVKLSSHVTMGDLKGLQQLQRSKLDLRGAAVISVSHSSFLPLRRGIEVMPVTVIR